MTGKEKYVIGTLNSPMTHYPITVILNLLQDLSRIAILPNDLPKAPVVILNLFQDLC